MHPASTVANSLMAYTHPATNQANGLAVLPGAWTAVLDFLVFGAAGALDFLAFAVGDEVGAGVTLDFLPDLGHLALPFLSFGQPVGLGLGTAVAVGDSVAGALPSFSTPVTLKSPYLSCSSGISRASSTLSAVYVTSTAARNCDFASSELLNPNLNWLYHSVTVVLSPSRRLNRSLLVVGQGSPPSIFTNLTVASEPEGSPLSNCPVMTISTSTTNSSHFCGFSGTTRSSK